MTCLVNCFGKHYRYLAYANAFYTYMISGQQVDEHLKDNYEGFFNMNEGSDGDQGNVNPIPSKEQL